MKCMFECFFIKNNLERIGSFIKAGSNAFCCLFLISCVFSNAASAQQLQGRFHDWNVFKANRGDISLCYLTSIPIKSKGDKEKKGESFFLVTNIDNDADEIGVSSGFIYDQQSDVELSFGSKKFYLFPYKALAWANDKNEDIDIIKEMQKQPDMIVSGVGKNGKRITDTYSLIGFTESYEKMQEVCEDSK